MTIKTVDKSDLDNFHKLNNLFGNETSKEEIENHFAQCNHEIICIAYLDNIAAGFCAGLIIKSICHKKSRLDIEALYVRDEYRQKGIGKALINFAEKEAQSRGISHFHILADAENDHAIKLYENLGYAKPGEILLDKTADG